MPSGSIGWPGLWYTRPYTGAVSRALRANVGGALNIGSSYLSASGAGGAITLSGT